MHQTSNQLIIKNIWEHITYSQFRSKCFSLTLQVEDARKRYWNIIHDSLSSLLLIVTFSGAMTGLLGMTWKLSNNFTQWSSKSPWFLTIGFSLIFLTGSKYCFLLKVKGYGCYWLRNKTRGRGKKYFSIKNQT